jgi:predicted DNA-binding transcriptional regulator AlpA
VNERLLTSEELAERLGGMSVRTLDAFAYKRTGPAYHRVGRRRLYRWEDVERWLAERKVEDLGPRGTGLGSTRVR